MDGDWAGRMAVRPEARDPSCLGFVGIDRKGRVAAAARMHYVILTATQRTIHPGVHQIEGYSHKPRGLAPVRRERLPGATTKLTGSSALAAA